MADTSTQRNRPLSTVVSNQDQEQLARVTAVIASAFKNIPVSLSIIRSVDKERYGSPQVISFDRRYQHFKPQIQQLATSGAVILQAGDWSVVAIWTTPDCTPAPDGPMDPLVQEYVSKCDAAMWKHLKDSTSDVRTMRACYHLEFIARNPEKSSVQGGVSAVIMPLLERARRERLPVWLEAATERSVQIYQHYGFRVVEEMVIGAGRYDVDGQLKQGGKGVSIFAMILD